MTLSPSEIAPIWDDLRDIIAFVTKQSTILRHKFGELVMKSELNPAGDTAISPAVMATYPALCTSTYIQKFKDIRRKLALQKLDLYWIFGLNFTTPGKLFKTLPVTDSLIIPLDKLPAIRASLALRVLE